MSNLIRGNKVIGVILIVVGAACMGMGVYALCGVKKENTVVLNSSSQKESYATTEVNGSYQAYNDTKIYHTSSSPQDRSSQSNRSMGSVADPSTTSTLITSTSSSPSTTTASNTGSSSNSSATNSSTKAASSKTSVKATATDEDSDSENHKKGVEFEKYIVGRFGKKTWSIKEWRSDKSVDGRYVESSMNPDLEMKLKVKDKEYVVAIECKWRSSVMSDGKIKWSYADQIKRYNSYARKSKIPVFVAMGIGGSPSKPDHVYLIPLSALPSPTVYQASLKRYEVMNERQFFYDTEVGDFRRK